MLAVLDVVRDESSKDAPVRLVFEPKTSKVDRDGLITALLAEHPLNSLEEAALKLLPQLVGSFCLTFMDETTLYAARDPYGIRPLCLGRLDRGWVVASETAALDIVGHIELRLHATRDALFARKLEAAQTRVDQRFGSHIGGLVDRFGLTPRLPPEQIALALLMLWRGMALQASSAHPSARTAGDGLPVVFAVCLRGLLGVPQ